METGIINLKRKEKFSTASVAATGFTVNKVVVKIGDVWVDSKWSTLQHQTFETLTRDDIRFMVECEMHGNRVFIVTHEADAVALRQKYPVCGVIYLNQIIGMLAGLPKQVDGWTVTPELLMGLDAEVIGHGKR